MPTLSLTKATAWAVSGLALLMLGLTLIPAEVWKAPATDAAYTGFDPNLVYVSKGESRAITISTTAVEISAPPDSYPNVILATTPVQKFKTSLDVTISESQDALTPFRIGLWSPWSAAGLYVEFGPAPGNLITALSTVNGGGDITWPIGDVVSQTNLGRYELGRSYRVEFVLDKGAGSLTSRVSGQGAGSAVASVNSQQSPKLFADVALSLTAGNWDGWQTHALRPVGGDLWEGTLPSARRDRQGDAAQARNRVGSRRSCEQGDSATTS